ncbi:MAG: protoglobin domain-containing protein [Pseudomonadota bacterium]
MDEFDSYLEQMRAQVRPPWTVPRAETALDFGEDFVERFAFLRRQIKPHLRRWPEDIIRNLLMEEAVVDALDDHAQERLLKLTRAHGDAVLRGQFAEDYFDTLDAFALFFVHHGVWSSWVSGAIKRSIAEIMATIVRDRSEGGRLAMMRVLTDFLVLELDQIHRVYALARHDTRLLRFRRSTA